MHPATTQDTHTQQTLTVHNTTSCKWEEERTICWLSGLVGGAREKHRSLGSPVCVVCGWVCVCVCGVCVCVCV